MAVTRFCRASLSTSNGLVLMDTAPLQPAALLFLLQTFALFSVTCLSARRLIKLSENKSGVQQKRSGRYYEGLPEEWNKNEND